MSARPKGFWSERKGESRGSRGEIKIMQIKQRGFAQHPTLSNFHLPSGAIYGQVGSEGGGGG